MKLNLTLALVALTSVTALAQVTSPASRPAATSPIKLTASTSLVTEVKDAAGKQTEKLGSAARALPGNILQMSQKVQNVSSRKVGGLRLNMRVDRATTYQNSRCDVANVNTLFSIDNGKTFVAKPTKTVTVTENGKSVKKTVPATPSEYTNVRWMLPDINAGQTFNCHMRVKVK